MPAVIEIDSMSEGYASILAQVLYSGELVSPRGMDTYELLDPIIVLNQPEHALPLATGRQINPAIAALEAAQLCAGNARHDLMAMLPNFKQYCESNGRFYGAYGERMEDQIFHVVDKLEDDPDTRQAVITLWDKHLDNTPGKKDYPCTVGFQFVIRNEELHCTTWMRSNDVWLGLAYDLFQFSQLQWTIANELGVAVGRLTHKPTSLHLYDRDVNKVAEVSSSKKLQTLAGFTSRISAYNILNNIEIKNPTETEQWYVGALRELHEKAESAT